MGFQHWRLINSVQAKKLLNPGGLFLNYYFFFGGAVEVVWSGGVWMEAAKQPNRRLLQVYCPILSVLQAGAVLNSSWLMIAPPFAQGFWYILIIHGTGNAVLNQPGLLFFIVMTFRLMLSISILLSLKTLMRPVVLWMFIFTSKFISELLLESEHCVLH